MRPPPIEMWPDWANYAAEELSSSWYWHAEKPTYVEILGQWVSKGRVEIVPRISVYAKDSLVVRP